MRMFRTIVLALLIVLLIVFPPNPAQSQEPNPFPLLATNGSIGDLVYGSVQLDGRTLFAVAAAKTSTDDQDRWGTGPLKVRIRRIENRLRQLVNQTLESDTGPEDNQIVVNQLNSLMVVQATRENATDPLSIVTVTGHDTEIYGLPAPELSEYYAQQIQSGLDRAYRERQPSFIRQRLIWVVMLGLTVVLLTRLSAFWKQKLLDKRKNFTEQLNQTVREMDALDPLVLEEDPTLLDTHRRILYQLSRKISHLSLYGRMVRIAQFVLWLLAISLGLYLFPYTRALGVLLVRQPIWFLLIWFGVTVAIQISHLILDRGLHLWATPSGITSPRSLERKEKRLPTLFKTLKGMIDGCFIALGIVATAQMLLLFSGFELFASVGALGLAGSIAFQSLIQDLVTGSRLLFKDAYAVGDIVTIVEANGGSISGYIESMELGMTQIRGSGGELITVRHGNISNVQNLTKDWSRIDISIDVSYDADADKALCIMGQIFEAMAQGTEWKAHILDKPDILAIDQLAHSGVTLRIRAKTAPMQQWGVEREFLHRLKQKFAEAGIEIGRPQQTITIHKS